MLKKIRQNFSHFMNNIGMMKKLMFSYFVLIILSLGLFSFVIYYKVSENMKQQIIFSASQSMKQTALFLQDKLERAVTITDTIFFNIDIQSILSRKQPSYLTDINLQNSDYVKMINILSSFQKDRYFFKARLYVSDGFIYSNENVNIFNLKDIMDTAWYRKLIQSREKVLWCPPQDYRNPGDSQRSFKVVSVVRKIRNMDNLNDFIGVVQVDILEDDIRGLIGNACISENGIAYIINGDGELITANNDDGMKALSLEKLNSDILNESLPQETPVSINKQSFIVNSMKVSDTDWTLISLNPYEEVISTDSQLKRYMLIVLGGIIGLAYIFAYLISRSSTKRIGMLVKSMDKLEQGNFEIKMPIHGRDEVGMLMDKFSYMAKSMEAMVEERFQMGQKIKSAELKALQSQINPHFLYNTLDMINWSAVINNIPDIELIVQNLAKFYKLSLSKGHDVIPIADEIEHVKAYVEIQNQRFEDRISFELAIDNEVYCYGILKIILQPIVENAIFHGIMEKESKTGIVRITGRLEQTDIIFLIEDDGVGISEDKIQSQALLLSEVSSHTSGYGMKNINDRIKLYYGEQYGLKYTSEPGKGTRVEVRVSTIKL